MHSHIQYKQPPIISLYTSTNTSNYYQYQSLNYPLPLVIYSNKNTLPITPNNLIISPVVKYVLYSRFNIIIHQVIDYNQLHLLSDIGVLNIKTTTTQSITNHLLLQLLHNNAYKVSNSYSTLHSLYKRLHYSHVPPKDTKSILKRDTPKPIYNQPKHVRNQDIIEKGIDKTPKTSPNGSSRNKKNKKVSVKKKVEEIPLYIPTSTNVITTHYASLPKDYMILLDKLSNQQLSHGESLLVNRIKLLNILEKDVKDRLADEPTTDHLGMMIFCIIITPHFLIN